MKSVRRGRKIIVGNTSWTYRVSKTGTVLAYSESGERKLEHAYKIKGLQNPDVFANGKEVQTELLHQKK